MLAFLLAAAAILRPSLGFTDKHAQRGVLLVALDCSESMTILDELDSQSRWAYLQKLLKDSDPTIQKLQDEQPLADAQVIALEEHVDYWNHDGWNDPYSSAEWTQRQLAYSDLFKAQAYTPQMVVDGQVQIVGSNTQDAALAIDFLKLTRLRGRAS